MMTALQAKKFANEEALLKIFYTFLNHNYPKFMESFKVWEQMMRIHHVHEVLSLDRISDQFN